ncbi:MAG TPA: hypothetical protein VEC94_13365 [Pseudolabrys sp.]|nr:hypothetical protein [Pseudolabrys sp.]
MPAQKRLNRPAPARAAAKETARLALDMEQPLNDALDAAHALRLVGYGLAHHLGDDEGRAVAALAWITCGRLDALKELWRQLSIRAVPASARTSCAKRFCA